MVTKRPLPRVILQANLKLLLQQHGMTGPGVAAKAKVDRKTVNNMLNARYDPQPEKVDAVAKVFGLNGWQLLRALPEDVTHPKSADELLDFYYRASDEDRVKILGIAEMAAKFRVK